MHNRAVTGTANPNPWTERTASSVNYTEIHDNSTLYDKLVLVEPGRDDAYYALLQRTAIGLVLLAQGMPVLHAGMEFLRTKEIPRSILRRNPGLSDLYRVGAPEEPADAADGARDGRAFSHNSYNLSDAINGLAWERRAANEETVAFTRRLIAIRKAHAHFRLREESEVAACLSFIEPETGLLAWRILDPTGADPWAQVCAVVNPGTRILRIMYAIRSYYASTTAHIDGLPGRPRSQTPTLSGAPPVVYIPIQMSLPSSWTSSFFPRR